MRKYGFLLTCIFRKRKTAKYESTEVCILAYLTQWRNLQKCSWILVHFIMYFDYKWESFYYRKEFKLSEGASFISIFSTRTAITWIPLIKKVREFIQSTRKEIIKGGNIKKVLSAMTPCLYGQYHCIITFYKNRNTCFLSKEVGS